MEIAQRDGFRRKISLTEQLVTTARSYRWIIPAICDNSLMIMTKGRMVTKN